MSMNQEFRSFDDSWERNIYARTKHQNRYPFGELVPHVLRLYGPRLAEGERPRVLELGSGCGNNLVFFAREGFEVHGIEGSASACEAARSLLGRESLSAQVSNADFIRIPYPDEHFDLIVDRESVCANRKQAILEIAKEVRRSLKRGGRFLSFAYSTSHGSIELDAGTSIEANTYSDFREGPFAGCGTIHFCTEEEFRDEYLGGLDLEFAFHHVVDHVFPKRRNQYAEYIGCGRKP